MRLPPAVTSFPAPAVRVDRPLHGIAFILVGASVFPVQDVLIKGLSGEYAVLQIVFVRSLVSLGIFAWLLWRERESATFPIQQPWLHGARGLLGLVSFTTYYMAIAALPLATVTAVAFAAPLFVTTLSALVLGEAVDRRGWSAVVVGFVGVLVVLRPGAAAFDPAALLAVLSALCYAISQTITRYLGRRNSGATIVFSATLVSLLVAATSGLVAAGGDRAAGLHPSLAFLVRGWTLPPWGALGRMALCGLISSVGHLLPDAGLPRGAREHGVPVRVRDDRVGRAVGLRLLGRRSRPWTVLGVATTVAAGVYVLHHQARAQLDRRRAARAPAAASG